MSASGALKVSSHMQQEISVAKQAHLSTFGHLKTGERLRSYWSLIKSLQTGLLLFTGIAAYMSTVRVIQWPMLLGTAGSLFMSISGSTVLNMVIDRDIDALMSRTAHRPLPSGVISCREALVLGLLLSVIGVGWAFLLMPAYGLIVLTGLIVDVMVYTIWLKRRSPWSILWGGISGGMPALAGQVLATGSIEPSGLLLALAVLLWIPTHIMTFSIKYAEEYKNAGVPVFPNTHSISTTRSIIAVSTILAALTMSLAAWQIGVLAKCLTASVLLGILLSGLSLAAAILHSSRLNFILFKSASIYMLGAMIMIIAGS